jgi:hypothetical protein
MTVYECSGSKTFWNVGAAISKRGEQDFHKFWWKYRVQDLRDGVNPKWG